MKAKVIGGSLRLREDTSVSAGILLILPDGHELTVKAWGKEWTKVVAEDTEGYVMSKYLEALPDQEEEPKKKPGKKAAKKSEAKK